MSAPTSAVALSNASDASTASRTSRASTASTATTPRFRADLPSREEMRSLDKMQVRRLTEQLLRRLHGLDRGSDEYSRVRGTVVELNTALVHYVARGFARRRAAYDDIFQTGTVGLLKAIDGYDVDRGSEFASFALPTISGEIKRFFRDTSWGVHVTRTLQERFLAVTRTVDQLEQDLGREPTAPEIGACLDMTVPEVNEAREASRAYLVDSIDAAPSGNDGSGRDRTPLADLLGYDEAEYGLVDFRESVRPLLSALPQREKRILEMRFWQDLTQREIGEELGVSQMHISRILNTTLTRLRRQLEADPMPRTRALHRAA
ncbi:SigB/SigF/SigG family RNA polymerase sigma factor [Yinghuangia sp. YIM S09857]|uniref:SigB/SigF/SigG family RNA polymerase sigma factor n=1 Tax=Yinghuangia sp. YIM S09857 TaxID=3436929 RepID=UPI003F539D71